jgi:hypothetical protein
VAARPPQLMEELPLGEASYRGAIEGKRAPVSNPASSDARNPTASHIFEGVNRAMGCADRVGALAADISTGRDTAAKDGIERAD